MNLLNLVVLTIVGLDLILFVALLIKGKAGLKIRILRKTTLSLTITTIIAFLLYTVYFGYKLGSELSLLKNRSDSLTLSQATVDSLLTVEGGKDQLIDSLLRKTEELEGHINRVENYERIAGKHTESSIIEKAKNEIDYNRREMEKVMNYNEIIAPSEYKSKFPKGYHFSGETQYFSFYPPVKTDEDFIDFSLKFVDDNLVSQVEVIYIETDSVGTNGHYYQLQSLYYKPQAGLNSFKIRNYLRRKGTRMMVGFFWKKEVGVVDTPKYEKITYVINP